MSGSRCRMALVAGVFLVGFVVVLAMTTKPVSAHPHHMHHVTAVSEALAAGEYGQAFQPCCHMTGTCVVKCLPFVPATEPLDGSARRMGHTFAPLWYASILSATDPPPPRP
jgi:hypothetical protein